MEDGGQGGESQSDPGQQRWWQRRWLQVAALLLLVASAGLLIAAEYVLHNAEPILRKRIIETLSGRFHAPVELNRVDISLFRGIEVEGTGLRIPFVRKQDAGPGTLPENYPLLAVQRFTFRTSWRGLLRQPTHVTRVRVDGMELHIPPASERDRLFGSGMGDQRAALEDAGIRPKIAIVVSEFLCTDVRLFLERGQPGKVPLEFKIATLALNDVGPHQAMRYDAQLTNPKPVGTIHAEGHFGPWAGVETASPNGPPGEPGATPLDGTYTFDHADLNSIKGIGGTLSSTGRFAGVLDRIVVDGQTDVPNFSLDISNHELPLHTNFHAIVDGTSGDTYLEPVQARLAGSDFTVSGKVVKVDHVGHDIELEVQIPHGRVQDFLRLAAKTSPPLMSGALAMKASLRIPPGDVRVPEKLRMAGTFQLQGVRFNNAKMQDRIDGLSARAQGRPQDVAEVSHDGRTEARSALAAGFTIGHGVMSVTDVRYAVPGALVLLNGVYSMDGRLFEFKGHVRTDATASQMVGGWKGLLLKPLDSLLKKNGAGLELPIEITGTEGDMHLGLAMHGTDQTPGQMLADVKGKARDQREVASAQREAAQADAEDAAAARAPTLEAAERAHNAAVKHRAEAQSRLLAVKRAAGGQER